MDIDEKKPAEEVAKPAKEEIAREKPVSVKDSLASIVAMLESAVKQRDIRLIASRLLRQTAVIRGQLTPSVLVQFFNLHFGPDAAASKTLLTEQLQVSASKPLMHTLARVKQFLHKYIGVFRLDAGGELI